MDSVLGIYMNPIVVVRVVFPVWPVAHAGPVRGIRLCTVWTIGVVLAVVEAENMAEFMAGQRREVAVWLQSVESDP
jgi:methylglyoxal synthase